MPIAASAAIAAAIQPTIGMLMIAALTARHAVTAASLNVAKPAEAIPANVADAVPPVTSERIYAPRALIPDQSPTVANRTAATVAWMMFLPKPSA